VSITRQHFEPGATWTFIHSTGKRTEYVYENLLLSGAPSPDGKSPGLATLHRLRNPETGGFAMVTEKWMREPQIGDRSHWLAGAEAMQEAA
jgi:hypothetical protein